MRRRELLLLVPALPLALRGAESVARGRIKLLPDKHPVMAGADGKLLELTGDHETLAVLRDQRLSEDEFELRGHPNGNGFEIDPIHTRSIFIWRGGKRLMVTYWCDICSIRAWTPGKCQCCQEEMRLDPRDPALKDTDPSH